MIIIYLCVLVIFTILGLTSGLSSYYRPTGHSKFPWYYDIYAGLICGVFSPILLILLFISTIQNLIEYFQQEKEDTKPNNPTPPKQNIESKFLTEEEKVDYDRIMKNIKKIKK